MTGTMIDILVLVFNAHNNTGDRWHYSLLAGKKKTKTKAHETQTGWDLLGFTPRSLLTPEILSLFFFLPSNSIWLSDGSFCFLKAPQLCCLVKPAGRPGIRTQIFPRNHCVTLTPLWDHLIIKRDSKPGSETLQGWSGDQMCSQISKCFKKGNGPSNILQYSSCMHQILLRAEF